jgi:hypothetical protein
MHFHFYTDFYFVNFFFWNGLSCRSLRPEPEFYRFSIYNIKGQLIRSPGKSSNSSGDHTFQWDGRDDSGKQVSGGIYFVVVEAGRKKAGSRFYI